MSMGRDPYDEVTYPGFAYPDTHPDRLAAMAILHGLSPAPVDRCRVLEIACNEGANLIPMAYAIPGGEFVGFDLARLPIERGQTRVRELGLTNTRLFQGHLLDLGPKLGEFDFIIAHGIYSWVSEPVRDRLLALCGELLAPHGVAFISYAAMPGGHLRNMLREMMLFRAKDIEDPERKIAAGLDFLRILAETRPEGDANRVILESQLKRMREKRPVVLFHDELSPVHHPVLFSEFVEHARRHGLEYLSEAVLPPPPDLCYRADLRPVLESAAGDDIIAQEQVLDFMRMRVYRETLLCRAELNVRWDYSPEYFRRLLLASHTASEPGEAPGARKFSLPSGINMETAHAGVIAMMEQLGAAWPHAVAFAELKPNLSGAGFVLDRDGVALLMRLAIGQMIELRAWKAPLATEISTHPRATAYARLEARTRNHATTLLHASLQLDDQMVRSFLLLLDGTRDRAALSEALRAEYPETSPEQLEGRIEPNLQLLYSAAVLEA